MKNFLAWTNILCFPASLYLIYLVLQENDPVAIFVACISVFLLGVVGLASGVTSLLEGKDE